MSFQIQSNIVDQEQNAGVGRRTKLTNKDTNVMGPKRSVLGTITNQVRVQPSRSAKGTIQDENAYPKQKAFGAIQEQPFSIFVDSVEDQSQACATKKNLTALRDVQLTKTVTSLPIAPPLSCLSNSPDVITIDEQADSPMVLDTSVETETKLDREAVILNVPEYAEDIFTYMKEAEAKHRPKPGYMKKQSDITDSMRSILVDWLVEVSEEYKIHRETLFLAVNYIDRFLSQLSVMRGKLQLVGAASMFLAGKYEEIYPPDVSEFVYITDDTYTKKQVLRMEHLILKVLSFDVAVPTANWFCERMQRMDKADPKTCSLAYFLSEITLVENDPFLKYLPSQIAAASLCLANYTLGLEPWSTSMQQQTGYQVEYFASCLQDLYKSYCKSAEHPQQAIREKYKASKFHEVSTISPPASLTSLM